MKKPFFLQTLNVLFCYFGVQGSKCSFSYFIFLLQEDFLRLILTWANTPNRFIGFFLIFIIMFFIFVLFGILGSWGSSMQNFGNFGSTSKEKLFVEVSYFWPNFQLAHSAVLDPPIHSRRWQPQPLATATFASEPLLENSR